MFLLKLLLDILVLKISLYFKDKIPAIPINFFFTFYFEIISNLRKVVRNTVKNSNKPLNQIDQLLTFLHICFILFFFHIVL